MHPLWLLAIRLEEDKNDTILVLVKKEIPRKGAIFQNERQATKKSQQVDIVTKASLLLLLFFSLSKICLK